MDAASDMDKLAVIIEREHALTKLQLTASQLRRDMESLRTENRLFLTHQLILRIRRLESENNSLNTTVEAYQESVRTKEELILRFAEQQQNANIESNNVGSSGLPKVVPNRTSNQPIPLCTSRKIFNKDK